jgi:hypothetical protein
LLPDSPSPTLPMKGRVPVCILGTFEDRTHGHTLPLVGRDGEGE